MKSSPHSLLPTIICGLAAVSFGNAETFTGAAALHSVSDPVTVQIPGSEGETIEKVDEPRIYRGVIEVRSDTPARAVFQASNRLLFAHSGPGSLAIERFEQIIPENARPPGGMRESGRSRMILNFREGVLAADSLRLGETSKLIVETPVGRISTHRSVWMARIEYDSNDRSYHASIRPIEGELTFTDRRDTEYPLRAGQQLSGFGGGTARPVFDVTNAGERTEPILAALRKLPGSPAFRIPMETFRTKMNARPELAPDPGELPGQPAEEDGETPIFIEYAPPPPPLTPVRGILER